MSHHNIIIIDDHRLDFTEEISTSLQQLLKLTKKKIN